MSLLLFLRDFPQFTDEDKENLPRPQGDLSSTMPDIQVSVDGVLKLLRELRSAWKTAYVSAIYKKDERFKASNYRPVSLTCISCKKFEHIIVSSIMRPCREIPVLKVRYKEPYTA